MNPITIIALMDTLFAPWFAGPSWSAWRVLLKAVFALPMDEVELAVFCAATGRATPPTKPVNEVWILVGRRGGKSIVAALVIVFLAFFRSYTGLVVPGEIVTLQLVAADRRQARTLLRYVRAFVRGTLMLAALVLRETRESIDFSNGVVIEITTCSNVATRSYTLGGCANDEIAYWATSEDAAQPDVEVLAAQRPALSTIPGAVMFNISTGYSRRGALYAAYEAHYGQDGDPVLFWKAPSRSLDPDAPVQMNPSLDVEIVRRAFEEDQAAAASEWNADFRSDIEKVFTVEMLDSITDFGRPLILPPSYEEVA
jgi:phage terminase large subunit-like protein